MRRFAVIGAAVLWGLALAGGVSEAHANYVKSTPGADARLVKAPTEVRIEFSELPDARGSDIAVLDASGKRHDDGDVQLSGDPNGLKVSLQAIGDGGYLVAWTATSAVDGHVTKGAFAFVIGSGPLPTIPDVPDASPPPSSLEILGRSLSYAGIALGLGTAFFVLFVAPTGVDPRRESWLLAAAGTLVVAGSLVLALDKGTTLPPRLGGAKTNRAGSNGKKSANGNRWKRTFSRRNARCRIWKPYLPRRIFMRSRARRFPIWRLN